ncbi:hypothetical protein DEI99_007225 [Curtobacterium sp. MCLR17_036]|uniref:hypothetical protein n=1 Tax=Curtobacterium sp. MCLR17_036 TaxID=2175620 RepID=UPI0011B4DF78|nr:hypothetical protein [Curtobacterium sp. MCLR17_036]WIE66319.1 hypothetical protein DEI99_007225 [Curtobacterium sp. MCLR17_036]
MRVSVGSTAVFPALARSLRALRLDGADLQIRLPTDTTGGSSTVNATLTDPTDASTSSNETAQRNAQAWRDAWSASG